MGRKYSVALSFDNAAFLFANLEGDMKKKNYQRLGSDKFQRQAEERTIAALQEKHKQFAIDHASDTNEQLAEYLRQCAKELDRSPNMDEVIGGRYIAYRFDGWTKAVTAAGLSSPQRSPDLRRRKIFKDEYKIQILLLKQENKEKQQKKARKEHNPIAEQEKEARIQRDEQWRLEHEQDSDEELLAYVRKCAEELGHSPFTKEVVGGTYLTVRFGSWPMVLQCAELPMAQGMKPPTPAQVNKYYTLRKRRNAAKQ